MVAHIDDVLSGVRTLAQVDKLLDAWTATILFVIFPCDNVVGGVMTAANKPTGHQDGSQCQQVDTALLQRQSFLNHEDGPSWSQIPSSTYQQDVSHADGRLDGNLGQPQPRAILEQPFHNSCGDRCSEFRGRGASATYWGDS